jgi:hypothetical protein
VIILVALFLAGILIPHIYHTKIIKIVRALLEGIPEFSSLDTARKSATDVRRWGITSP